MPRRLRPPGGPEGGVAPDRIRSHAAGGLFALSLGAVGVVFGDIGTSPLYAVDMIERAAGGGPADAVGAISLAVWTLTVIVSVKYAALVLRAHNDGEGGVFALYGLLHGLRSPGRRALLWLLMLGAGLLLGDGAITPAISVLSATEGLKSAAPTLSGYAVPLTLVLLTALFAVQSRGASKVGGIFGPILVAWFLVIGGLGLAAVLRRPGILEALDPVPALSLLARIGPARSMATLGALMLVVTGGEAMYADLGHFGARPIRLAWFVLVYPALLLNYLGQGARLLGGAPVAGGKLFFSLAPPGGALALVLLATAATVIASQALISGAFSLISQAIGLGLFPRLAVRHTDRSHAGQIYVPVVNWGLYGACVALVLAFRSSEALGSAYGLAVSGVMVITSLSMIPVARRRWNWSAAACALVWGPLTALNGAFLAASLTKFLDGGAVPVAIGLGAFCVMATWKWGRKAIAAAYASRARMTMAEVMRTHREAAHHIERNALVMVSAPIKGPEDRAPALLSLMWSRTGVWPRHLVLVHVTHPKIPYVHGERCAVTPLQRTADGGGIVAVDLRFGFMEEPNVEAQIEALARHHAIDLPTQPSRWIVHVAHENFIGAPTRNLARAARFRLFQVLRLVSRPTYYGYGLGDRVQLSAEIMPVRVR